MDLLLIDTQTFGEQPSLETSRGVAVPFYTYNQTLTDALTEFLLECLVNSEVFQKIEMWYFNCK